MKITAYETQGKLVTGPDTLIYPETITGRYKIHVACVYGNFFQRHSWEKLNGQYEPDKWIKSFMTSKESFDRVVSKWAKVELDIAEEDFK
jgi:hypothetical protein